MNDAGEGALEEDDLGEVSEPFLPEGARLGRYTVETKIGHGAMGVVYAATNEFGERVALKVISSLRATNPEAVSRFRAEAAAASRIGHRNIAEVFEFGTAEDGSAFIAMELLDGEDLRSRLGRQAVLSPEELVRVAEGVAAALAVARECGIVHRDLKPENIFLARSPGVLPGVYVETVKVLDFGISKALGPAHPHHGRPGKTGILGTPEYMAPEQASEGPVDARTDIYALGCVMYECTTGRPPFRGTTFIDILMQHLRASPVLPSKLVPPIGVPEGLEVAIVKALAKDPNERFQNIEDFAAAIRRAVTPAPSPPEARAIRPLDDPTRGIVERITREYVVPSVPKPRWPLYVAAMVATLGALAFLFAVAGR